MLNNPYTLADAETKELRVNVHLTDAQYLHSCFPKRGLYDGVLGPLFHILMTAVRARIPLPTSSLEYNLKEAELQQILSELREFTQPKSL